MEAELHSAFVWDCDICGVENFCRAIEGNLDEAHAVLLSDIDFGERMSLYMVAPDSEETTMPDGTPGAEAPCLVTTIALAPKNVTCAHCGAEFKSQVASNLEEE